VVNLPTHPLVSDADAEELGSLAAAAGAKPLGAGRALVAAS
jgi:hypothetical protein